MRRPLSPAGSSYAAGWNALEVLERTAMTNLIKTTIGCDLSDKETTLFVLEDLGGGRERTERPRAIKTTPEAYETFFSRERAHVVLEVGTHSRWASKLLRKLG